MSAIEPSLPDRPPEPERRRLEIRISPMTFVLGTAVFFLAWAITAVSHSLLIVAVGVFLGLVFEMPVRLVMRHTPLGRGMAATVIVIGSLVAATLLALLLLSPLVGSVRDFVQDLPELVEQLRDEGVLSGAGDTDAAEHAQSGADWAAQAIPNTVSAILGVAGKAASTALMLFTVTFVALFFLTNVADLRGALASVLFPRTADRTMEVWERITFSVSKWAIGALTIALIAGTVQGTTAWLLGSSYALALGIIAGVLDLIPNIGATIAGFILSLTLLAEEGLTAALIMLAVVLVYQQLENNILSPTIYGKAVDISAFFIITSVTLFGALLGVLGALVAVPLAASVQIVLREVTTARREQVAAARAALEEAPARPA